MATERGKIVIIGAGHVGSAILNAILGMNLAKEIVLINLSREQALGEVMDASHTLAFSYCAGCAIRVGDYPDCADAQIIINTAGPSIKPGDTRDRMQLLETNLRVISEIMEGITRYTRDAILINVTNPVDVLTYFCIRKYDYPRERMFSTGTLLDTARFNKMLSDLLGIDAKSVTGFVLGEGMLTHRMKDDAIDDLLLTRYLDDWAYQANVRNTIARQLTWLRGDGVYGKVMKAIELLHRKKLVYGISACYTSANFESITSEAFFDQLIGLGCYFIWYFHYMPVGNDASPELLPTPEQRIATYHRIRKYRAEKPLFAMDFQNDAEYVGGCIAGGRRYLHINANGDVDPCVFIHYSDSNIREKTLLECLQSPIFMAYHDGQPFNKNMLRPCPMLENPQLLREIVHKTGAHSTDLQSPESVDHLCDKCVTYAENWKPEAERLWEDSKTQKTCGV